jgi:cytochrome c biogenesis protein CcdA
MAIKLPSMFALALLLIFVVDVNAESVVYIEFFYLDPQCHTCLSWRDTWEAFKNASQLIDEIQNEYGNQVQIERLDKTTPEGLDRFNQYDLMEAQAVVINHTIKLEGEELTKENLKNYIDAYLRGENPSANPSQPITAFAVLSLGLFSGLSPCLMAMLAFILSYTSGTVSNFKSGMFRVLVFGTGFILAILLLGAFFATTLASISPLYKEMMMWTVSILMILIGLNLIGLLNVLFRLELFAQKLTKKYGTTTIGLFILGFIFYFVNLCAVPLSFTILPTLTAPKNMYLLALFSLGVLIPFLSVGIVAGGSPTLAKRIIKQYRYKIRALSGIILLVYSVWFIVFNLL